MKSVAGWLHSGIIVWLDLMHCQQDAAMKGGTFTARDEQPRKVTAFGQFLSQNYGKAAREEKVHTFLIHVCVQNKDEL